MNVNQTTQEINKLSTAELARSLDAAQQEIDSAFEAVQAQLDATIKQMADSLDSAVRRLNLAFDRYVEKDGLCDRCDAFAGDCLQVDRPNPTSYRQTDTVCGPCRKGAQ